MAAALSATAIGMLAIVNRLRFIAADLKRFFCTRRTRDFAEALC